MSAGSQKTFTADEKLQQVNLGECQAWMPARADDAHKGSNGRVMIVGGEKSMAGACCLAGWAGYIAGAGLVRVATIAGNVTPVTSCRPELLVTGIEKTTQLNKLLPQIDVVALGPGLGQTKWSRTMFEFCLEHRRPNVMDADALNLLAHTPDKSDNWVLTPHVAEAARLLNCHANEIQSDRVAAAREIVSIYGGTCILKGKGSLVVSKKATAICNYGNSALAVAGTGDVLTGLLAGLLAQGMEMYRAAAAAVAFHACAAEIHTKRNGGIGMLASDLMQPLRQLRNGWKGEDES